MRKTVWAIIALTGLLGFFALTCDDEGAQKCDPNNFRDYCEDEEVICSCDSETKKEKCESCSEVCMQWKGKCVETENAMYKCECLSE